MDGHDNREQHPNWAACHYPRTCKRQASGSNPLTGSQQQLFVLKAVARLTFR
jgi:hypothetical protein